MNNEEKILTMLEQMLTEQGKTNQRLDKLEQGQAKLEQGQAKLEHKMDKGFDKLENLINIAADDAARTERKLMEHIEQPVH